MNKPSYIFTSESVSEGHPDKIADQISDAILDAYLTQDPDAKVACECLITTGNLIIAGEVSSSAHVDVVEVARNVIERIGYNDDALGFNAATAAYTNLLHEQSQEIRSGVLDGGAGDQGLVFGYACQESPELLPLPLVLAHGIVRRQSELRKNGKLPWLRPDAKSQVSLRYEDGKPVGVEKIVFSTQHSPEIDLLTLGAESIEQIIRSVIEPYFPGSNPEFLINPAGSFTVGGPHGDTGLTGRKIIVDTYGGSSPHGGGAFSGKDATKVDRSGAYAARYVAKHIVTSGLASRCTVQISYAIGVARPTSIHVDTHGTGTISDPAILSKIVSIFELTPQGIIRTLGLKRPIYLQTAAYGHFGKPQLPWEQVDPTTIAALLS